jgi:CRP/FNR family transcriptional regulator, cyclic AMP receptor protein
MQKKTGIEALRSVGFLADVSDPALKALAADCRFAEYRAGQLIIGHLDTSCDVLFLLEGEARVSVYSAQGKQVSFRDIRPGGIFGEMAAIDGEPRSASIEAISDCTVAVLPQAAFIAALASCRPLMLSVLRHLTRQVRVLTARVFEFSTLAVRSRVHSELIRLAERTAPSRNDVVLAPAPTHQDIATRISTHREAVTREMTHLERLGIVQRQGRKLRIRDVALLRSLLSGNE